MSCYLLKILTLRGNNYILLDASPAGWIVSNSTVPTLWGPSSLPAHQCLSSCIAVIAQLSGSWSWALEEAEEVVDWVEEVTSMDFTAEGGIDDVSIFAANNRTHVTLSLTERGTCDLSHVLAYGVTDVTPSLISLNLVLEGCEITDIDGLTVGSGWQIFSYINWMLYVSPWT